MFHDLTKDPELILLSPTFLHECVIPEAITSILIAHIPDHLYLVLCFSALRSLAVLYLSVS